jgi:hypothetical protein
MSSTRTKLALALAVMCGFAAFDGHETHGATAAQVWPKASALPRADAKATLLVFVYADDATRSATKLAEVTAVVSTVRNRPFVAVVHVADERPRALWAAAGKVPQAARLLDKGGVEARRFGATATGHVVVYDANGVLRYSGASAQLRSVFEHP